MKHQIQTKKTYEDSFEKVIWKLEKEEMTKDCKQCKWAEKRLISALLDKLKLWTTIFEIGTFSGITADYIESLWFKVIRSDIVDKAIIYNKNKGKDIICFNVLKDRFKDRYEAIFAKYVFQHFTSKQLKKVFVHIEKWLENGWYFCFAIKTADQENTVTNKLYGIDVESPRFCLWYSKKDIDKLLKKIWWKLVYYELSPHSHNYIIQKII